MKKKFALLTFIAASYIGFSARACTFYGYKEAFVIECPVPIKSMDYITANGSVFQDSHIMFMQVSDFVDIRFKGRFVSGNIYSFGPIGCLTVYLTNSTQATFPLDITQETFLVNSTHSKINLLNQKRAEAKIGQ